MTQSVECPVRAGDWVAVRTESTTYYVDRPTERAERWDLARVTHATRDGRAVEWEDGRGYRMGAKGTVFPIPHSKVSREACAHLALTHTYDDSVICRPWDTRSALVSDLRSLMGSES